MFFKYVCVKPSDRRCLFGIKIEYFEFSHIHLLMNVKVDNFMASDYYKNLATI